MKSVGFVLMCLAGIISAHFIPGGPLVALIASVVLATISKIRSARFLTAFFAIPGLSALWWYGLTFGLPNGADAGPGSYLNLVQLGWLTPIAYLVGMAQVVVCALAIAVGIIGVVVCITELTIEN